MDLNAVIRATGMVTPVGINTSQSWSSVRAGLTRMREAPDIYTCIPDDPDFEDGQPLVASTLSYLETPEMRRLEPVQWLAYIAAQAFFDLEDGMELDQAAYDGLGMFVSLPPNRGMLDAVPTDDFMYHFHNTIEKDPPPHQQFAVSGHAGALSLIEPACAMLERQQIRYALIGGVESYLFAQWLEILDRGYRIKSDRNPDGFTPGEAAAWILLEPRDRSRPRNISPPVFVNRVSCGNCDDVEPAHNTGTVLSELLRELLPEKGAAPVIFCDLNGEPSRAGEWGYTLTRLGERLGNPVSLKHPADCLGDVGAASGTVLAGLAARHLRSDKDGSDAALVWTASDSGERSALLLGRNPAMTHA